MIKKVMKKKAVSDVVATVLIILLTVSAVALLVSFISPFVEKNLDSSTACLPYKEHYQFEQSVDGIYYNCYQINGSQVLVGATIKFGSDLNENEIENLNGLLVVFSGTSKVETVNLTNGKSATKTLGGVWELEGSSILEVNGANEIRTYVYNTTSSFSKAEIYPVLKSGKICEISDSINLEQCSGAILNE